MIKDLTEVVREQLENRRQRAITLAAERQQQAYNRCNELYAVDGKMAQAAMEIAAAAMSPDAGSAIEQIRDRIMSLQAEKSRLLATVGMSIDDLQPQHECDRCGDTGFAQGKRCSCWSELYSAEAGKRLPVAATDGSCSFDSFSLDYYPRKDDKGEDVQARMRSIAEQCAEYAERVGQNVGNLLFIGKTGLGKTHLSLAIASRVAERGKLVKYSSAQGVVDRFERTRFGRSPSSDDWDFVAVVSDCDLLVIDDLGSEFVTSFSQSVIYNIINDRMMSGRETVISTNLDAARIVSTYEQRISSRLLCGYRALGFAGKDIRMLKRM